VVDEARSQSASKTTETIPSYFYYDSIACSNSSVLGLSGDRDGASGLRGQAKIWEKQKKIKLSGERRLRLVERKQRKLCVEACQPSVAGQIVNLVLPIPQNARV
jgi:hypothetical protein